MIILLSPAKSLDETLPIKVPHALPRLLSHTRSLLEHLKPLSSEDLEHLMKISPKLAGLNHERFQNFASRFTTDNSGQALFTFTGDVFKALDPHTLSETAVKHSRDQLRILSGLYGLLRPEDLIQPYRLEMGTRLAGPWGKGLYDFWGDDITRVLNQDLAVSPGEKVVVNLASQEYFKVVKKDQVEGKCLNIAFKEETEKGLRVIGIHAKRARGAMARFIIENNITRADQITGFTGRGYRFEAALSSDIQWVFSRATDSI